MHSLCSPWWHSSGASAKEIMISQESRNIISAMQTTTAFELAGFRTSKTFGGVRGITVRTRSLPMSIVGGLRTLFGGRAGIFSDLCESAREEAFRAPRQLSLHEAGRNARHEAEQVRLAWTDL